MKYFLLIALGFMTLIQISYAQLSFNNMSSQNETILNEYYMKNKFRVGFETVAWSYTETVDNAPFIIDEGRLNGVSFFYQDFIKDHTVFWDYEFRYLSGETNYDGGNTAGENIEENTRNTINEHTARLGFPLLRERDAEVLVKPYVGFNYRVLMNPATSTPGSYDRRSEYRTIPVGTEAQFTLDEKSIFSLDARFDVLLAAKTESELNQVDDRLGNATNEQNDGSGWKIKTTYERLLDKQTLTAALYYRRWDFSDSKADVVGRTDTGAIEVIEPENKTEMTGINLGVSF